ncbi:hypothetical protein D3C81_1570950 [compost metagenome]
MGRRRHLEVHDLPEVPLRQHHVGHPGAQHQQQHAGDPLQVADRLVAEEGDHALGDGGQQDAEDHRPGGARLAEHRPAECRAEHVAERDGGDEAVHAGPADQHQELGDAGQARTLGAQRGPRDHGGAGAIAVADVGHHRPGDHHQRQPEQAVLQDEDHAQCRGHAAEEPGAGVDAGAEPGPYRVDEAVAAFLGFDLAEPVFFVRV